MFSKNCNNKTTSYIGDWWMSPQLVVLAAENKNVNQQVPQVTSEFFHNLWIWLQRCKTQIRNKNSSTH